MSSAREKMRQQLRGATEQSQNTQNKSYNEYETYFNLPEGVENWSPKGNENGVEHYIDIIPFKIGTDNFPNKMHKNVKFYKGDYRYCLDVWVHRNVGPDNATVLCPKSNYIGEDCPICNLMDERQRNEPDEKKRKAIWVEMKPYRRVMYNIICRDNKDEEEKGIQIYEVSHFYMESELIEQSRETRGEKTVTFSDPEEGKTVTFKIIKRGSGKESTVEYKGHKFVDRIDPVTKKEYVITDDILDAAVSLDSLIKRYTYDELLNIMAPKKSVSQRLESKEEKVVEEEEPSRSRRSMKTEAKQETPQEDEEKPPFDTDEEDDDEDMNICPQGDLGLDYLKLSVCEDCPDERMRNCKAKKKEIIGENENSRGKRRLAR